MNREATIIQERNSFFSYEIIIIVFIIFTFLLSMFVKKKTPANVLLIQPVEHIRIKRCIHSMGNKYDNILAINNTIIKVVFFSFMIQKQVRY
jgi:hypothetical protein